MNNILNPQNKDDNRIYVFYSIVNIGVLSYWVLFVSSNRDSSKFLLLVLNKNNGSLKIFLHDTTQNKESISLATLHLKYTYL